jgi:hypothetical protein
MLLTVPKSSIYMQLFTQPELDSPHEAKSPQAPAGLAVFSGMSLFIMNSASSSPL